jgi:hypothetical protein
VTSVPEYEAPQQTPPFMIASTADPPTWDILSFKLEADTQAYAPVTFSVEVVSEDIGTDVEALFYLVPHVEPLSLYADDVEIDAGGKIPAGSLDSPPRVLSKSFRPPRFNDDMAPLCFTLFWVAAHRFDTQTDCPAPSVDATGAERDDSSRLTWTVLLCNDQTECAAEKLPECLVGDPVFPCDVAAAEGAGS